MWSGKDHRSTVVIKRMPSPKLLLLMPTPAYVYESLGLLEYTANTFCLITLARRRKTNLNVNFLPKKCETFIFPAIAIEITTPHTFQEWLRVCNMWVILAGPESLMCRSAHWSPFL